MQKQKGISIRKPNGRTAWLNFLRAYVTRETALPPEERLLTPSLSELETLLETIETNLCARNQAQARREAAVDRKHRSLQRLRRLLQTAILLRVVLDYDGVVTNHLEQWGIPVVPHTPPKRKKNAPPEETPVNE